MIGQTQRPAEPSALRLLRPFGPRNDKRRQRAEGLMMQNKANSQRPEETLTSVLYKGYEKGHDLRRCEKQSQFAALRLLRRWAPRNDIRARGSLAIRALMAGSGWASVQNKANSGKGKGTVTAVRE